MPISTELSLSELQRLIARRQRELKKLVRQRDKIQLKLDNINDRIATLGGSGTGSGSRPRNSMSLNNALISVIGKAGKPLPVGDILDRVLKSGYRSSSANFRAVINQTLIKDRRFAAVSRGVYGFKSK